MTEKLSSTPGDSPNYEGLHPDVARTIEQFFHDKSGSQRNGVARVARLAASLGTTSSETASTEDYKALYMELLYAVARKWPGETRHQTALRYIQRAESQTGQGCDDKRGASNEAQ